MKKHKKSLVIVSLFASLSLILGACANANNDNANEKKENNEEMQGMDHSEMDMSGEVPKGMKEATNPTYKVGSKAIINANHMKGMNGAKATIVGAYDTTVYAVSYTPTTGGNRVENHKWVVQEDIKDAGDKSFKPGSEVTLEANHMEGMKGATAKIDTAEKTTVYMVDYKPTTGGKEVKNHKWVTESELSAAE
ncbi:YdhK family protein [Bacillus subtilis]|uniref:YdhK family protein n=1 Tax=Bacillus subtilis group TaxID=653685 RepID=UPI0011ADB60A|nr:MULTISPECIES: YdhK family protein [Bacillus subtilis group]MEC1901921.1 YdhK family protein [Bacillus atrophaeus]MEC2235753.1 YdhK family protein [Bacillus subtilis]MEC2398470.1 YdhK family protein [Bacillus atrophaeus]MED4306537.1 YdhK family protein [Bacillus licheniformis]MED4437457.1 YdhK family protein [Bacillus atrophaeus]